RRLGGLISSKALRRYNVKYRKPVRGEYRGHSIFSMSPPSSGGIHIIQILNTVEKDQLRKYGVLSPEAIHLTASAMQAAFSDRAKYLGDSDFVRVPVTALTSKKYADSIRAKISMDKARPRQDVIPGKKLPYESNETTHFSVADSEGYIVVSTQTLNGPLGSGVVVPGTGIILNNEMDDFSTKPGAINIYGAVGGQKNLVEPEKRPLSSMSPTIVYKDGRPLLALGSPNGTRILTCVAQTILNYLEFGLPLYESVAAVRFHHQWTPDEIRLEEVGLPKKTMQSLRDKGHKLRLKNWHCKVQAVAFESGKLHGVSDPRGQGKSFGK
ncbi:MAG: gamma-glutamyltransferase, partial [Halobacteriovoraceae bacterium]|nr:gamma-glutamyltransferase [Halobacteriovoraceae bacterium]